MGSCRQKGNGCDAKPQEMRSWWILNKHTHTDRGETIQDATFAAPLLRNGQGGHKGKTCLPQTAWLPLVLFSSPTLSCIYRLWEILSVIVTYWQQFWSHSFQDTCHQLSFCINPSRAAWLPARAPDQPGGVSHWIILNRCCYHQFPL